MPAHRSTCVDLTDIAVSAEHEAVTHDDRTAIEFGREPSFVDAKPDEIFPVQDRPIGTGVAPVPREIAGMDIQNLPLAKSSVTAVLITTWPIDRDRNIAFCLGQKPQFASA